MKVNAGNLKKGDFINHRGAICSVQKADFYSPGKGSALMRTKIKNLLTAKNVAYVFKSNEQIEVLEVETIDMQYLYKDGENLYFMNNRDYSQHSVPISIVGEVSGFLKEGGKYFVYLYNNKALTIRPPMSVRLKVVETQDAVKGDRVTSGKKPAKMETGVTVMVPLFIKKGETIIINPETGEYVSRG